MKSFVHVHDVPDLNQLLNEARMVKENPYAWSNLGKHKTIGLIFLNPSLRTRLSMQKAAMNLGMQVMVMNIDKDGWALEMEEGVLMNGTKVEHIKDAAAVIGSYCDIVGIRCFPSLTNKAEDDAEMVLNKFKQYLKVPLISMESATLHPLQSFADLITIESKWKQNYKPKVVLTWAPHIKPVPQAVANSFSEWMLASNSNLTIACPPGFTLNERFTKGATICHNQQEALQDADFVYVKNWSAYHDYGKVYTQGADWMLTNESMKVTNNAYVMHCLPVRRNLELSDELLDGPRSLVQEQAANRVYAAQAVIKNILEHV